MTTYKESRTAGERVWLAELTYDERELIDLLGVYGTKAGMAVRLGGKNTPSRRVYEEYRERAYARYNGVRREDEDVSACERAIRAEHDRRRANREKRYSGVISDLATLDGRISPPDMSNVTVTVRRRDIPKFRELELPRPHDEVDIDPKRAHLVTNTVNRASRTDFQRYFYPKAPDFFEEVFDVLDDAYFEFVYAADTYTGSRGEDTPAVCAFVKVLEPDLWSTVRSAYSGRSSRHPIPSEWGPATTAVAVGHATKYWLGEYVRRRKARIKAYVVDGTDPGPGAGMRKGSRLTDENVTRRERRVYREGLRDFYKDFSNSTNAKYLKDVAYYTTMAHIVGLHLEPRQDKVPPPTSIRSKFCGAFGKQNDLGRVPYPELKKLDEALLCDETRMRALAGADSRNGRVRRVAMKYTGVPDNMRRGIHIAKTMRENPAWGAATKRHSKHPYHMLCDGAVSLIVDMACDQDASGERVLAELYKAYGADQVAYFTQGLLRGIPRPPRYRPLDGDKWDYHRMCKATVNGLITRANKLLEQTGRLPEGGTMLDPSLQHTTPDTDPVIADIEDRIIYPRWGWHAGFAREMHMDPDHLVDIAMRSLPELQELLEDKLGLKRGRDYILDEAEKAAFRAKWIQEDAIGRARQ